MIVLKHRGQWQCISRCVNEPQNHTDDQSSPSDLVDLVGNLSTGATAASIV